MSTQAVQVAPQAIGAELEELDAVEVVVDAVTLHPLTHDVVLLQVKVAEPAGPEVVGMQVM